jgi:hypothetical protein
MASNFRVINLSNGYRLKPKAAQRAVANGAAEWVELGVSIRSLSLAESIQARNKISAFSEPIAWAELPGLRYEPTVASQGATREEFRLMREANRFAAQAVMA